MRLVLVRHGDAHAGFHGPIAGPSGCRGLTDLGRRQALSLADELATTGRRFDALITSRLKRAIQTSDALAPVLGFEQVLEDCDLCEVHTGDADGVDWADYPTRFGSFDMVAEPDRPFAPGGDSWNSFHSRVDAMMHRLARDHPGQSVIAATSAGVIAATLRLRFGGPFTDDPTMRPTNTGLTEWEFDESSGSWTLHNYDDHHHLARLDTSINI